MTVMYRLVLLWLFVFAATFAVLVGLWHLGVANAGTGPGVTGGGGTSPKDVLDTIIAATVTAGLAWVSHHVVGWLKHSAKGKKAAQAIDTFHLEQMVAERAIDYVEEQAHKAVKAGKKVVDAHEKLHQAVAYAKDHGLVDDGLHRVEKIIEARLGAKRPKVPAHGLIGAESA